MLVAINNLLKSNNLEIDSASTLPGVLREEEYECKGIWTAYWSLISHNAYFSLNNIRSTYDVRGNAHSVTVYF